MLWYRIPAFPEETVTDMTDGPEWLMGAKLTDMGYLAFPTAVVPQKCGAQYPFVLNIICQTQIRDKNIGFLYRIKCSMSRGINKQIGLLLLWPYVDKVEGPMGLFYDYSKTALKCKQLARFMDCSIGAKHVL